MIRRIAFAVLLCGCPGPIYAPWTETFSGPLRQSFRQSGPMELSGVDAGMIDEVWVFHQPSPDRVSIDRQRDGVTVCHLDSGFGTHGVLALDPLQQCTSIGEGYSLAFGDVVAREDRILPHFVWTKAGADQTSSIAESGAMFPNP